MHHHRYGGVAIAGGLVTNENLSSLTISANLLGAVAADALFRAMSKNSKVEYLNLHHNAIYDWEHPETVESLVAMLQTNDKLTRWGDRDRGGGGGGVCGGGGPLQPDISLPPAMPPRLSLDLSRNGFESSAAEAIARALHTNTSLVNLNIANNPMSVKGGTAFGQVRMSTSKPRDEQRPRFPVSDFATTLPALGAAAEHHPERARPHAVPPH